MKANNKVSNILSSPFYIAHAEIIMRIKNSKEKVRRPYISVKPPVS
jgi:hypothetical protein